MHPTRRAHPARHVILENFALTEPAEHYASAV